MEQISFKVVDWSTRRVFPATGTIEGNKVKISFKYNHNILKEIKGCEGATFDWDNKVWSVLRPEYSPRSAVVLGHVSNGTYPGTVANPLAAYDEPLRTDVHPKRTYLKEHQVHGLRHMVTRRRCHVTHEMGLGKSLEAMELLEWIKDNIELDSSYSDHELFWVIAPKAPLRAWEYELVKHNASVRPRLIMCSDAAIGRAWAEARRPPFALILDESSRFKSATSKRTQMVLDISKQMAEYWKGTEFVVCLSGTPAPNDPTDWWSQIEICKPGFLRERNVNQLKERLAIIERAENAQGSSYSKIVGWRGQELELLYKRLQGMVDIKFKKDCVDLPEKIRERTHIKITQDILNAARTIVKTEPSALKVLQGLRQLADGFQYRRDEHGNPIPTDWVGTPKLDALKDELESLKEEGKNRVVIYAAFVESVDRVVNCCVEQGWGVIRVDGRGWHGFNARAELDQFQDRDLDRPIAFVANADSGGLGITLTASDTIIYYSNSFNYESRAQSEDRIHRIGMKGAIIKDFIYMPTDLLVLDRLLLKRDIQAVTMGDLEGAFLDAMNKE